MRRSSRPQPALGMAIRQVREKHGKTQESLADEAGITERALSQIETGNANPTWATIRNLAAALGVSMGDLAQLADGFAATEG
jgi:transcriptional regulator with XRE-family HTH domain